MSTDIEVLIEELLKCSAYRKILRPTTDALNAALREAESPSYRACHLQFMWDFIQALSKNNLALPRIFHDDESFERNFSLIRDGHVIDLSLAPYKNAYYSKGFIEEVTQYRLGREPGERFSSGNPKATAALGRSVLLASYVQGEKAS